MEIHKQLKLLRHELELTQSEFGQLVGLQSSAVGRYERGQQAISAAKAQEIARQLGYEFRLKKIKEE